MEKIFNPKTIALIGATNRPGSVGLGLAKNLLTGAGKRKIFFVNPFQKKVLGKSTYSSILSVPDNIDLAIIAVSAKVVPQAAEEAAQKKVGAAIIISAGFSETGKVGEKLQQNVSSILKNGKIDLIGPNCLGIIRPKEKLNATFAPATPAMGNVAFLSQSGALIDSVIDQSLSENYGFSAVVSYGNEADLGLNDFFSWLKDDAETKVIVIYTEGIKKGREFMKIARLVSCKKPVIVLKAGKSSLGQRAISSHTSALVGSAEIHSAAFKQSGVIEVNSLEELFDSAKALVWQPRCKNSIGIITNGGGAGVLAADYCDKLSINLLKIKKETIGKLEKSGKMNPAYSKGNPLDIVGDALSDRYEIAVKSLMDQKDINGLLVIQTTQIMTEPEKNAKILIAARKKWPLKPIVACFMGGKLTVPAIRLLEKNHIPNYSDPSRAVSAINSLLRK